MIQELSGIILMVYDSYWWII